MGRQTQVPPSSMAVTLTALLHHRLSHIPYVFRHFDLLVLKLMISTEIYEQELKIKNFLFTYCHSKGLVMKVTTSCDYFSF